MAMCSRGRSGAGLVLARIGGAGSSVVRKTFVVGLATAAVMLVAAGTSSASGPYGGKAAYQVGFSFNCDNMSSPYCGPSAFGLGGFWGWYAFNSNGSFDAQVTFCGHGQGVTGAFHQSEDGMWKTGPTIIPLFGNSTDFYTSTDGGATWQDTMIPYGAGHYSVRLAPGVSANVQVSSG